MAINFTTDFIVRGKIPEENIPSFRHCMKTGVEGLTEKQIKISDANTKIEFHSVNLNQINEIKKRLHFFLQQ